MTMMDSERERERKKLIDLQNSRNGFIDAIFKFNNDEVDPRRVHILSSYSIHNICVYADFVFRIPFRGHKFTRPIFIPKSKRQKTLESINHSTPSFVFTLYFSFSMCRFFFYKFTNVCAMQIAKSYFSCIL